MFKQKLKLKYIVLVFLVVLIIMSLLLVGFVARVVYKDHLVLPLQETRRTVVSISSFSQRVFHMRECLDSILTQSTAADRVIISIPKTFRRIEKTACWFFDKYCSDDMHIHYHNESVDDMLVWFSEYTGSPYAAQGGHNNSQLYEIGALTVQFLQEDWGPATKLIGALLLETHGDTVIITIDDDVVYHKDTVKYLTTHIQDNMALAFGCETWSVGHIEFIPFGGMSNVFDYTMTPRYCAGWLYGWTGAAYHVSSFGDDIWTFLSSLPLGCLYNDDIWLSGYLANRGVRKVYVPNELHHKKHTRDKTFSVSTIIDSHVKYKHACARYLFPA